MAISRTTTKKKTTAKYSEHYCDMLCLKLCIKVEFSLVKSFSAKYLQVLVEYCFPGEILADLSRRPPNHLQWRCHYLSDTEELSWAHFCHLKWTTAKPYLLRDLCNFPLPTYVLEEGIINGKVITADAPFNMFNSLSVKAANALSLGANKVKPPSCLSRSINPAASIRDKKILQHKEEKSWLL